MAKKKIGGLKVTSTDTVTVTSTNRDSLLNAQEDYKRLEADIVLLHKDMLIQIESKHEADVQRILTEELERHPDKIKAINEMLFVGWKSKKKPSASHRFFRFCELSSRILPSRTRMETFEPAYNDAKADYLLARRRYTSKWSRRWLATCFALHVGLMVLQCVWGMCSEKVKQALISLLPEILQRLWRS